MGKFVELKPATVITKADAKRFYKEVKSSGYGLPNLVKAYTLKVAGSDYFLKQMPLGKIDDAAAKISVVHSKYPVSVLRSGDGPLGDTAPSDQWTINVAKRINPVPQTALRVVEGVSEVATGSIGGLVASSAPSAEVGVAVGIASLVTLVYGFVNPIKKIITARSKNLQELANVIETAIREALKSVSSEQTKQ
ncbi:MAG: hypothetical protein QW568_02500 [Candidatus Anstonellaceae archaeon]